VLTVTVRGVPRPKPDPRCFGRGGHHHLSIPANSPGYAQWRERCTEAGRALAAQQRFPKGTPVGLMITVTVPRPTSHYRTGKNAHLLRSTAPAFPLSRSHGDIDKIQRLILDALTDSGVWDDDSQAVRVEAAKCYPDDPGSPDSLEHPGAVIRIWNLKEDTECTS
jgi:Holliday junction resolvase RusA-like endonuclease